MHVFSENTCTLHASFSVSARPPPDPMRRRWFLEEEDLPSQQDRAANLLGALAVGLNDRILAALEASLELLANSVAVLFAVDARPGLSIEEVRAPLGLTQTTAARLVAGLVSQGLMLREVHRGDARFVSLRTSELGRRRVLESEDRAVPAHPRAGRACPMVLDASAGPDGGAPARSTGETPRHVGPDLPVLQSCRLPRGPDRAMPGRPRGDDPRLPERSTLPTADGGRLYQERRIVDGADPPIELWLEPGGAAFRLPAGRRLEVLCRGDRHGHVELERLPEGHLALHAWPGAIFTVLEAGREIFVEERALSLSVGLGTTTRERVESIYGDFRRRREMFSHAGSDRGRSTVAAAATSRGPPGRTPCTPLRTAAGAPAPRTSGRSPPPATATSAA